MGVCTKPLEIECRAKQYKDKSLAQVGQKVTCDPTVGLICKGQDQGLPPVCLDYEIRVKCCIDTCVSTTAATTIVKTTTEKPAITWAEKPTTTTKATTEKPTITTTEKPTTTTKATTEKPTIKTTEKPTITTTEKPTTTTEKPTTTTKKPTTTTEKPTTTTKATTEKATIKTTEKPTTTTDKPTTTPKATTKTPTTTTEKPTITTTEKIITEKPAIQATEKSTTCHVCKWSDWTSNHYPSSGDDDESESIKDIKNLDLSVCTKPLEIECRAKQYKDKSLAQVGQKVTCDPTVGLICKGQDQGLPPVCLDYEIRVKCCIDTCVSTTAATTIVK